MFFDEKKSVFRKIKRILKDLQKTETDLQKRNFEAAFKDLRKGFLENKKIMKWLKTTHSEKSRTTI